MKRQHSAAFNKPELPDDLDLYLAQKEQHVPNLVPGTEKTIVWANPAARRQTEVALVYMHGFSATRKEVAPLCDELARALGANLFYTRLTGHGQDGNAMAHISVDALLRDAVEALEIGRRLGRKVILVGNSTGATLAVWLALHDTDQVIHSLVLLSPNFGLKKLRARLLCWPGGKYLLKLLQGPTYRFEPANSQQARFWTTEYPSIALLPMAELVTLVRRSALENILQPVLVLYSSRDQVVSVGAMRRQFRRFGTRHKHMREIENISSTKQHVLAGDIMSPSTTQVVTNEILRFLASVQQEP